jgi:hypothetical protein
MPEPATFRRVYGAHPMHLAAAVVAIGLAVLALPKLLDAGPVMNVTIWLVGAIVLHDLVFVAAYSAIDRVVTRATGVAAINYLRVPSVISGLLLVVYFPLVLGLADGFHKATGHGTDPYLWRWLAITGGLFAISAAAYGLRVLRTRR